MIKMECPHCGHQLRIRSKYAGKQGQCKHCQGFVDVPNAYAEAAEAESRKAISDAPTTPIQRPVTPVEATALADLLNDDTPVLPEPSVPVEATGLADLMAEDDTPAALKPTVPMAPDAMDPIAVAPPAPYKRLGGLFWFLVIFLTPVALILGILLPSGHPQKKIAILVPIIFIGVGTVLLVGVFVVLPLLVLSTFDGGGAATAGSGLTIDPPAVEMEVSPHEFVTLQTNSPGGMQNDVTWTSSDPSIAKVVGNARGAMVYGMAPGTATVTAEVIVTGEQAMATVIVSPPSATTARTGVAYAETRLPSYPGLVFSTTDVSENELAGPLAQADPAGLTTFSGNVNENYETVSNFFYNELQNRGWTIDDFGTIDPDNGETYILGRNGEYGIVYRTRLAASRTRVVITYGPIQEGV